MNCDEEPSRFYNVCDAAQVFFSIDDTSLHYISFLMSTVRQFVSWCHAGFLNDCWRLQVRDHKPEFRSGEFVTGPEFRPKGLRKAIISPKYRLTGVGRSSKMLAGNDADFGSCQSGLRCFFILSTLWDHILFRLFTYFVELLLLNSCAQFVTQVKISANSVTYFW